MKTVKTFMTLFLQVLFCGDFLEDLNSYFSEDVCVICITKGKKSIGRDDTLHTLWPEERIPFLRCDIVDFSITEPVKNVYCTVSDCVLPHRDSRGSCALRVSSVVIGTAGQYSIVQIQISPLSGNGEMEGGGEPDADSLRDDIDLYRRQLDAAIQHCGMSLWDFDIKKRCIYQRNNSIEMHGLASMIENVPDSLIQSGYVHPTSAEAFLEMYRLLMSGEPKAEGIFRVRNAEQTGYWWEKITYLTEYDTSHRPVKAIGFSTDITEHVLVQKELQRMNLQKELLTQKTLLNMVIDFTSGRVLDLDASRLDPVSPDETNSYDDFLLLLYRHTVDARQRGRIEWMLDQVNLQRRYEEGEENTCFDFLCSRPGQEPVWAQFVLHVKRNQENDHLIGKGYVENIHERKQVEMDLKSHAEMDGLTQVYNRETFRMLTDNALSARSGSRLIIFGILDVDNFKSINDEFGHAIGDAALQKVAKALKSVFRQEDFVGRLGGDEFMFALSEFAEITVLKRKLNQLFRRLHASDSLVTVPLYVSIGIAVAPWDGDSFDSLYQKADIALYRAKNAGKNDWCIYQGTMEEISHYSEKEVKTI